MKKLFFFVTLIIGCTGPTGPEGPIGPKGDTGAQGNVGVGCAISQTLDGGIVTCRDTSVTLTNGTRGQAGIQGNTGSNGSSCSIVSNVNGATITCTDGTTANIANGANGATGAQGVQGNTGQNGTSVNVVQFCANYVTTYPSSFPEFGVCIANSIYAVYWDNTNAWLALVTPGTYKSTSTSAPCNFTVQNNCVVSP